MKVWMFPFASAGGRQLRRTNRLETRTGTTSLGAEGRTLELRMAVEEGEEAVRSEGTWAGNVQEGKEGPFANAEWCIPIDSKGRKERECKDATVESKVY